ncbi:LamG domain-containing protein [Streptomyces mirabilis]|uniref:LamG domain-containing protein n=1 Tax=Streptomyces sp. NPDC005388 TaxID=3156717 RepID=UPI0033B86EAC
MSTLTAVRMARHLTAPFGRGADSLALTLLPGSDPAAARIAPYDFRDHRATFGHPAEPTYVLALLRDCERETVVALELAGPGSAGDPISLTVPAGTRAGTSYPLRLPDGTTEETTLTGLVTTPAPADGSAAERWSLTALLGTTGKLLWALGAERDQLRHQLARTLGQRHLSRAIGASLDLIGADLGVPRFPPLPYGYDEHVIALYHLDDEAGADPQVEDLTGRYPGRTGHHGTISGPVQPGSTSRYGRAFRFAGSAAVVTVESSPDFDIGPTADATVECFVRPDPGPSDGLLLTRHPDPATGPATGPAGWVLGTGDFGRGLPRNLRFAVGDGASTMELFADLSLPTDRFSHVAAVLDRGAGRVTLYVDGKPRDHKPLGQPFGAVGGTAPLLIGPAGSEFLGTIDEVRLSSVARTDFFPVLGESDEHYGRRLRIFRRWILPTPANLTEVLNTAVGRIGSTDHPLVVDDANRRVVRGTRVVTVVPVGLLPGEVIDRDGRRRVAEADTVGTAADEELFDPVYLLRHERADVDYTPPAPRDVRPYELPPDPHRLQLVVADPLDRLADLAAAEAPAGRLRVESAFDPRADDLRATGRALMLRHSTLPPGRLAALAHRAGFDFVRCPGDADPVYAACAVGDHLGIDLTPPGAGPTDLTAGSAVQLAVRPALPADAFVRWLTVPCGPGRATVTEGPAGTATLRATGPGGVVVKVDVSRGGHTLSATRTLRAGPADLADGAQIAADGTLGAPASVVGGPDPAFDPVFLTRHDDPRAVYGTDPNHRLVQHGVAERLDALLGELDRQQVGGKLNVVGAFDPAGDELAAQGRGLTVRHGGLPPGRLAAAAHAAGFGHVRRAGSDVVLRHTAQPLVAVAGPDTVAEGESVDLRVVPPPAAVGADTRLDWASGAPADGLTSWSTTTQPAPRLTGVRAGAVWVQAAYLLGDGPAPYTFEVRLRPELPADTVISKDQYDLIMNILNALHPIGVEVSTLAIRERVIEIRGEALAANPDHTFPKFRVRSGSPRRTKETSP